MNPTLQALAEQVAATVSTIDSAVVLINGIGDRITAAVQKALENGATAEQLAPVTEEVAALKAKTDALSAAVAAVPA